MSITLYELAGADRGRRFSPYCWRARMALAHKGLDAQTVPWLFTDKDAIAFSGQGKVPVLVDGDRTVIDSWDIACYLEETYPNRPSLFGGPAGRAAARFINNWADGFLLPAMIRFVLADIHTHLDPADQDYFRTTREQRFGMPLEQVVQGRDERLPAFRQSLQPLRLTLTTQEWLGGDAPNYNDYIVFGCLQWARSISPFALLAADDPIVGWRDRVLDLFGGAARTTVQYDV